MNVTDEMVETALISWFRSEVSWDKGMAPWTADQFRTEMRATLIAALTPAQGTPAPDSHVVGSDLVQRLANSLAVFTKHYEPWMDRWEDDAQSSTFSRHTFGELRHARKLVEDADNAVTSAQGVTLTYTNWRGETAQRSFRPLYIWFGSTEWHPEPQWLLRAVDTDKDAERDFALEGFGYPPDVRLAALEEAAQLAEKFDQNGLFAEGLPKGWSGCRRRIAEAIRALTPSPQTRALGGGE